MIGSELDMCTHLKIVDAVHALLVASEGEIGHCSSKLPDLHTGKEGVGGVNKAIIIPKSEIR